MIPGNPYATETLDHLRAAQRRTLTVLLRGNLGPVVSDGRPELDSDPEHLRAEVACRELAAGLLEAHQEYLASSERAQMILDVRAIANKARGARWVEPVAESLARRLPYEDFPNDLEKEQRQELRDVVFLLIAADELAAQSSE